ncbi:NADPH-dependent oxidoreductase [Nakamurella silvestris]|nr:NADPH-dependent oxidoreductase [Nakamurella silvestris]
MKISIVAGNPKAKSRTLEIAEALTRRIVGRVPETEVATIDLADIAGRLFDWSDDGVQELNREVAASDLLIIATPTYKASYTGLLKAFLDRYPTDGLLGTTAIPLMTAGSDLHALASEVHLRPLLVELGASVPTRSLFFVMSRYEQLDEVVDTWFEANWPHLEYLVPQTLPIGGTGR